MLTETAVALAALNGSVLDSIDNIGAGPQKQVAPPFERQHWRIRIGYRPNPSIRIGDEMLWLAVSPGDQQSSTTVQPLAECCDGNPLIDQFILFRWRAGSHTPYGNSHKQYGAKQAKT